jgi:hypothetical protein
VSSVDISLHLWLLFSNEYSLSVYEYKKNLLKEQEKVVACIMILSPRVQ